jgi:hypothetical protein
VKIIKNERDPPLFTSKQLIKTSIPPNNFIVGGIKRNKAKGR